MRLYQPHEHPISPVSTRRTTPSISLAPRVRWLAAALLLATGWPVLRPAAAAERPHVVLVMADDMGWGETGYRGHPFLHTPHLDAMAASGLRCDRFYAGGPLCSPTRASVLTGRSPDRTGVVSHGYALRLQEKSVATALRDAGYVTGHFGKWHLDGVRGPGVPILAGDSRSPGRFGFDHWLSATNYVDLDPLLSRQGAIEAFTGDSSDVIVAAAVDFLRRNCAGGRPLFAVVWFGSPHGPCRALDADRSEFGALDKASAHHYGELVAVDRGVGTLRAALRELGIARDTLLVFSSDNGGLKDIAGGTTGSLRGFKGSLSEGGIRVPGIVEWPAVIAPRVTATPVCSMDLAVTIADVAGLPSGSLGAPLDGISLRPMFERDSGPRHRPLGFRSRRQRAWVDDRYKLHATELDGDTWSLFDLEADPGETRDLAADLPDVVARMREQFEAWNATVEASLAGRDYPEGAVVPPDPEPEDWSGSPAYEAFRRDWGDRPEYRGYLSRRTAETADAPAGR